ncbi:MAG: hypothetical protein MJK12_07220 [Colwellia sp.]|nr:hypothetical protein [Colwellia sp.]
MIIGNKNYARFINVLICAFIVCCYFIAFNSLAKTEVNNQESKTIKKVQTEKKIENKSTTIVINSQVKGTQEQPKVLYVMPWQGTKKPIVIDSNNQTIVMPKFKPINPKEFKEEISRYYNKH